MARVAELAALALAACTTPHVVAPPPVAKPVAQAPRTPIEELLDVSGRKLYVRATSIAGDSSPTTIITLHGGPGISHEYMLPFERLASPTTRVVSFDQRGVGRSPDPDEPMALTFGDQIGDVEQLRIAMHADKIDLIGHSFGGLIAMKYAIAHPEHTRSLILVDSLPPDEGESNLAFAMLSDAIDAGQAAGAIPAEIPDDIDDDCSPGLIAILPAYFADPHHPMTKHLAGSSCKSGIRLRTNAAFGHFDLRPQLGERVTAPMLVVYGKADPLSYYTADAMTAALKTPPKVVALPKCGHVPFEECPDELWPVIDAFLKSRP